MIQTVSPVLGFIWTISDKNIVVSHFRACNGKPCVYLRATEHSDMALPSSTMCTPNFLTVQNGFQWNGNQTQWSCSWNRTQWLTCGNKTRSDIEDYCEAESTLLKIQNPAAEEISKPLLMVAIFMKGFADCFHDCLLLKGNDRCAEYMAITSLVALSLATVLSFIWSSGFAEVFSSYNGSGCACYYVREAPAMLVGCFVPLGLLTHFLFRSDNVLRALTHGMYLFSWYDNVPVWLLRLNPLDEHIINRSLITPVIYGNGEEASYGNGEEELTQENADTAGATLLAAVSKEDARGAAASASSTRTPRTRRTELPMLEKRVPKLPACRDLRDVVGRGICDRGRPDMCSFLFVLATLLELGSCGWRIWLMLVSDSTWLFFMEGVYLLLELALVVILVVTHSNRFTLELRGGVLLVWLQVFTIRWCSSIVMDTLYFRTAKWMVEFFGHGYLLPVDEHAIRWAHGISNIIIGSALFYALLSYKYFVQEFSDRGRDILVDSSSSESTETTHSEGSA